jgi:CubicO group peptidase (beta-lactamase class C family)
MSMSKNLSQVTIQRRLHDTYPRQHGSPFPDRWGCLRCQLLRLFSTTKGFTTTCAHLLVQRGELDLDAPVADYWPEFAAVGKQHIPVRWLLSHRAGPPALDTPMHTARGGERGCE